MSEGTVDLEVIEVKHETDRALLVTIDNEDFWVPKSVIHDDSEVYSMKSGPGTLTVMFWWADKNGLCD